MSTKRATVIEKSLDRDTARILARYAQIQELERQLHKNAARITEKKTELKTLTQRSAALLEQLLEQAGDRGEVALLFPGAGGAGEDAEGDDHVKI